MPLEQKALKNRIYLFFFFFLFPLRVSYIYFTDIETVIGKKEDYFQKDTRKNQIDFYKGFKRHSSNGKTLIQE